MTMECKGFFGGREGETFKVTVTSEVTVTYLTFPNSPPEADKRLGARGIGNYFSQITAF
jgi:hypothetical protein